MDVRANLLPRFSRAEDSYYRDLWSLGGLGKANIVAQLRIVARRRRLIVVDAIQPDPKKVHHAARDM